MCRTARPLPALRGRSKKNFQHVSDLTGNNLAALAGFLGRRPTYVEFYGLWLNRRRHFYQQAAAVAFGAGLALGQTEPGVEYFDAISTGDGEARLMMAQYKTSRK